MKIKILLLLLTTAATLQLGSCKFSKGVKKDLGTGLTANYNGLTLDEIYLADAEGSRLPNNRILLGTKIYLAATGVDYFTETAGKVYPGCSIILKDKAGKEILNLADAFADLTQGTTAAEAKILQASLNTGDPMLVGETYKLHVQFYDKKNKENKIDADVNLQMK